MSARAVLEEVRSNPKLRREFAQVLAEDIALEIALKPEIRRPVILGIIENAATKDDINELKNYVDTRFNELKNYVDVRMDSLEKRVSDLYGIVKASLIAITITLPSTIVTPLILRLLGL